MKIERVQCDLRRVKYNLGNNIPMKIPPFTNDIGKNRRSYDLAYLTLKYKG